MAIRISVTPPTGYAVSTRRATEATIRGRRGARRPAFDVRGDDLTTALADHGLEVVETVTLQPTPTVRRARRRIGTESAGLTVDLGTEEHAAVLVEQNGLYTWSFGESVAVPASARRGVGRHVRRLRFSLELHPAASNQARRRGPVRDLVMGKVTAYVLRFVARSATDLLIGKLEADVRTGLVWIRGPDVQRWEQVVAEDVPLPTDRAPRILLLVHGTFSSTVGSFGALSAGAGRRLLETALREYDVILGFDHRTLSVDPLENARELLMQLNALPAANPAEIDAVAFSRGGLVFRSLAEKLLPGQLRAPLIGRVVFVACTNGGTRLADAAQWHRLIDLYTTISVAATRALGLLPQAKAAAVIISGAIRGVAALAKGLAARALDHESVPGLAAMTTDGVFVLDINQEQTGQPAPSDTYYCAVTSEFDRNAPLVAGTASELPSALLLWLADGAVDRVMGEPNDLVVNTASMTAIDPGIGGYIRDRLDFGVNGSVYHCNYFHRPEVTDALSRWLTLPGHATAHVGGVVTATASPQVNTNIVVVAGATPANLVRRLLRVTDAEWLIVNRWDTYYYAFSVNEAQRELHRASASRPLEEVLDLHEDEGSRRVQIADDMSPVPHQPGSRRTRARAVVLDVKRPIGVVPSSSDLPDVVEIAARLREEPPQPALDSPSDIVFDSMSPPRSAAVARRRRVGAPQAPASRGVRRGSTRAATAEPAFTTSPAAAPVPQPGAADGLPLVEIHCRAEMPQETVVQSIVNLHVTIAREALESAAAGAAAADGVIRNARENRQLIVQIVPRMNYDLVGDERVEAPVPQADRPLHVTFDVRAAAEGRGEVWVQVRQGPIALITLKLVTSIVDRLTGAPRRVAANVSAPAVDATPTLTDTLRISEEFIGGAHRLGYFVDFKSLGVQNRYESALLNGNLGEYITKHYDEIENRYAASRKDAAAFERDLRAIGATLFSELFPIELQRLLWTNRDRLGAIHVLSTEPHVPWEIVFIKDPDQRGLPEDGRFLAELGLVRWLYEGFFPPQQLRARPRRVKYVIPRYPLPEDELPSAAEEETFLKQTFRAIKVNPDADSVYRLMEQPGSFDVLHFGCHGLAESASIDDARLKMEGRIQTQEYIEDWVLSTTVEQTARLTGPGGERPLVVINACQTGRAGRRLSSIGGFAPAFIRAGAGALVAAHWSVGDDLAAHFVRELYEALRQNKTLAEAARHARRAARTSKDATWLAYTVYGEPGATLSLE